MRRALLGLLVAASSACAVGRFSGGVYRQGAVAFRIGALPRAWQPARIGGPLAFHHHEGGSISAHGSCEGSDDVPLDVLTNHLVIGLESRRELERRHIVVDGRAALRTRFDAALDGVPVALDFVVLKKDGCVYDLTLVTQRERFDVRVPDFDGFVNGFAVEAR
jgi:hypothetical protein